MLLNRTLRAAVLAVSCLFAGAALAQTPAVPQTATAPRVLGSPDAPVEVIEYASLTCHHCASFHNDVLPQVKKELIDTGKVRLVYRDFPLDRVALEAAILARCLPPERYFPVLSILFSKQDDWSHAKDPVEPLARIGTLAGLSRPAYDACRADKALQDSIVQSRFEGENKHGVESTPSFVIGGKTYKGVLAFDAFKKTVEPLLPKS
jgi:protein-disulfide isomerase